MEKSRDTQTRGSNIKRSRVPNCEERLRLLEPLRPLCACGCGEHLDIPALYKRCTVDYVINTYWKQFPTKQNHHIKPSIESRVAELEPVRPLCACGCGEKLDIPVYLLKHGASIERVLKHWFDHPYRQWHGSGEARAEKRNQRLKPLSLESLGCIYGTLLGDGSIVYPHSQSKSPRLDWSHGLVQLAWLQHKCETLPELAPKLRIVSNGGYGEQLAVAKTACHPGLREVYAVVRPNGGAKQINLDWLSRISEEGLAWWYMDDGSARFITETGCVNIQLHTEGYSLRENQILVDWLTSLGYPCKLQTVKRKRRFYYLIALPNESAQRWLAKLYPYTIPSMEYKFRIS